MTGIYKITSPTKRVYIGQSIDIKKRWKRYFKLQCKQQKMLYNSLKKHTPQKHRFEVIHLCEPDDLNRLERYYQELYNCMNSKCGLNLAYVYTPDRRYVHSERTLKKLSKSLKGRMKGENNPFYGKTHTEEMPKHFSEIKKISQAGCNNNMYGRKHSEETKRMWSRKRKGTLSGAKNGRAKKVICLDNLKIYSHAKECALELGVNYTMMINILNKKKKNKKNVFYLDECKVLSIFESLNNI